MSKRDWEARGERGEGKKTGGKTTACVEVDLIRRRRGAQSVPGRFGGRRQLERPNRRIRAGGRLDERRFRTTGCQKGGDDAGELGFFLVIATVGKQGSYMRQKKGSRDSLSNLPAGKDALRKSCLHTVEKRRFIGGLVRKETTHTLFENHSEDMDA